MDNAYGGQIIPVLRDKRRFPQFQVAGSNITAHLITTQGKLDGFMANAKEKLDIYTNEQLDAFQGEIRGMLRDAFSSLVLVRTFEEKEEPRDLVMVMAGPTALLQAPSTQPFVWGFTPVQEGYLPRTVVYARLVKRTSNVVLFHDDDGVQKIRPRMERDRRIDANDPELAGMSTTFWTTSQFAGLRSPHMN